MVGLVNADFFGPITNDINGYHYLNCYVQGDTLNSDYSYTGNPSCPYIYTSINKQDSETENCFTLENNLINTEFLKITNDCKYNNRFAIKIFNSNGELVTETEMNNKEIEISIKNYKAGLYILEISNLNGKYYRLTKKIILI
ncbi:MAG: T9SS type A sorting domain-containing protein [Bacteroidia bacterium]|nr:T9SS type A sorting domain-containing protein [Bacteroidia bacterium]